MKRIIVIIICLLSFLVCSKADAKEYKSDFLKFEVKDETYYTTEPDNPRLFKTQFFDFDNSFFQKQYGYTTVSYHANLTEKEGLPSFISYIISVELYDENKQLINTYTGRETYFQTDYNFQLDKADNIKAKYYKIVLNVIDDYYLDYPDKDIVIGEIKSHIEPRIHKKIADNAPKNINITYFGLTENYHMYMKSGAKFTRTIPKIYKNPENGRQYKIYLNDEIINKSGRSSYMKYLSEDDNNYYFKFENDMETKIKDVSLSYYFYVEPLDNSDTIIIPCLVSPPNYPIIDFTMEINKELENIDKTYFKANKMVVSDALLSKGYKLEAKEEKTKKVDEITFDKNAINKDSYIYKYYTNDNKEVDDILNNKKSSIPSIGEGKKGNIIIVIVAVGIIIIVAIVAVTKLGKPKTTMTVGVPMTSRPMGNSNMPNNNRPMANQPNPYGQQPNPYGQHPNPYGQQPNPYGQQPNPYGQQPNPYGQQPNPYSQQPNPYGQQPNPYGQQPNQYGQQPNNNQINNNNNRY